MLVDTLAIETEGLHTVMLLAVASYLVDAGNGVGIVIDHGGGRVADLWVEPVLTERLDVEIKTPQALRGPRATHLEDDEAEQLIYRRLMRAASTKSGQLSPDYSGVLAIGGYHLQEGSLSVLEAAAERVLTRQKDRKGHLAALVIFEVSYRFINLEDGALLSFTPTLESRLIRHPGYEGALEFRRDEVPWRVFSSSPEAERP